jgi:hypothetical protein
MTTVPTQCIDYILFAHLFKILHEYSSGYLTLFVSDEDTDGSINFAGVSRGTYCIYLILKFVTTV